jgi:hypothetical protein
MMNVKFAMWTSHKLMYKNYGIVGLLRGLGTLPFILLIAWKLDRGKKALGNHLTSNMRILGNKFHPRWAKFSRVWLLLRGVTLWTIWVKWYDLTSNYHRWVWTKYKTWFGKTSSIMPMSHVTSLVKKRTRCRLYFNMIMILNILQELIKQWLSMQNFNVLTWPPQSHDLIQWSMCGHLWV